jgi:hypothetical protein
LRTAEAAADMAAGSACAQLELTQEPPPLLYRLHAAAAAAAVGQAERNRSH